MCYPLSMYDYSSFKSTSSRSNADTLSRLSLESSSQHPPIPSENVFLLYELSKGPISVNQMKYWTKRWSCSMR